MDSSSTVRSALRRAGAGTALLGGLFLVPADAVAQACTGSPALSGQVALGGVMSTMDGATGWGAEGRTNPEGPPALDASLSILDMDGASDRPVRATVRGAWDLATFAVNACPVLGVEYTRYPDGFFDGGASSIGIPLGIALGIPAGSGSPRFLPSAEGGILWHRFSTTGAAGSVILTETDPYVRGGLTAYTGRLYGRAQMERVLNDDGENLLRFSIGALF